NEIDPSLFARYANRTETYAEYTTQDADVKRLRFLLVDFDAKRPAGISATDEQHEAALKRAHACRKWLCSQAGIETISTDSGNGGHILLPLDLENTPENVALLEGVLDGLGSVFDTETIAVDRVTYNPSR